mgnify:CR=1 FL=1
MQEVYVQEDMFSTKKEEPQEQAATPRRRIEENHQEQPSTAEQQTLDFSRFDFTTNLQIRESVARGAQKLIEIQQRRRTV